MPRTGITLISGEEGKVLKAGPKSFTERKMSLSNYREQKEKAYSMASILQQKSKSSFKGAKMSLAEKSSRDYSQMLKPDSAQLITQGDIYIGNEQSQQKLPLVGSKEHSISFMHPVAHIRPGHQRNRSDLPAIKGANHKSLSLIIDPDW